MRNRLPFSKPKVVLMGDPGEAQAYLGEAYALLFKVRQICQESGAPVFGMSRAMPDGAVISASINGGLESVSCSPPEVRRGREEPIEERREHEYLYVTSQEGMTITVLRYLAGMKGAPQEILSVEQTDERTFADFAVGGGKLFYLEQDWPNVLPGMVTTTIKRWDGQTITAYQRGIGEGVSPGPLATCITASEGKVFVRVKVVSSPPEVSTARIDIFNHQGEALGSFGLPEPNSYDDYDWMDYAAGRIYLQVRQLGYLDADGVEAYTAEGAPLYTTPWGYYSLPAGAAYADRFVTWHEYDRFFVFRKDGSLEGQHVLMPEGDAHPQGKAVALSRDFLHLAYTIPGDPSRRYVQVYRRSAAGLQAFDRVAVDEGFAQMMKTDRRCLPWERKETR